MAQKFAQIRYKSSTTGSNNYPTTLKKAAMVNGSAFTSYYPIVKLTIDALSGTKFFINQGKQPVIINSTGIFELDLGETFPINSLSFEGDSLDKNTKEDKTILIDIIYEG